LHPRGEEIKILKESFSPVAMAATQAQPGQRRRPHRREREQEQRTLLLLASKEKIAVTMTAAALMALEPPRLMSCSPSSTRK
jgi:hypothetical protein